MAALGPWPQPSGSQWIVAAAMGVLALASWVWPVVVYREGESEAFNMDDAFFVILALLVPPLLTLATLALASSWRRPPAGVRSSSRPSIPARC